MSDYEKFLKQSQEYQLSIVVDRNTYKNGNEAEGLFFTPLLALTILVVASQVTDDFTVSTVSTWCGGVLSQSFSGLKDSRRKLEWSLTLRHRCADAVLFLEINSFVKIEGADHRVLVTESGKEFINRIMKKTDSFGLLARNLRRTTLNVKTQGLHLL